MTQFPPQDRLSALLADRSLIRISGPDAAHFLNTLVTTDIAALTAGVIAPAALLSPQGKILFDFLISRIAADTEEASFLIDIAAPLAAPFAARLNLYKLRANAQIEAPQICLTGIFAQAQTAEETSLTLLKADLPPPCRILRDKRFPREISVSRAYYKGGQYGLDAVNMETARQNWDRLRLAFCLPEGGRDFALGDNFPHDVNYDCIGAIALRKGCYIGQELVSRMQHKAIIRKRLVQAEAAQDLPHESAEIAVNGRPIGRLGTVSGRQGLALIRLDKIPPAGSMEKAQANGIELHFTAPPYLPDI